MVRVLFVCMGNICRSPTAEAVFRQIVEEAGLSMQIETDSAGTSDYQKGDPPDRRAQAAASKRGYYDMAKLRARQVRPKDFLEFDYVLAMDKKNLADLKGIYPGGARAEVGLFLQYARKSEVREVPDPYYGGALGFDTVLDLVEDGARGFLEHLLQKNRKKA